MLHVQIFFYMKQQNLHVRKQSCLKKLTAWAEVVYNFLGFAGFKMQAGNINHRRTFL